MVSRLDKQTQTYRIIKRMIDEPTVTEIVLLEDFPNITLKRFVHMLNDHDIRRVGEVWALPDYLLRQVRAVEGVSVPEYKGCIVEPRRYNVMSTPQMKRSLVAETLERNKHRLKIG